MKAKLAMSIALLASIFALPFLAAGATFRPGVVYAPGLVQARIGGSAMDKTTGILSHSTAVRVPGAIMASTGGSAVNPYDGETYKWGDNTTFGYAGQVYLRGGVEYWFGKHLDDSGYLVIDGTVVLDNPTYNALATGSFTPGSDGWYDVEVRFGNGTGGAGAVGGTIGFGYNTDGISSFTAASFVEGGDWKKFVDDGDAAFLRNVYSSTPFFTISSVSADGDDLLVTAAFSGIPSGGAVFTACCGAADGGHAASGWDSSSSVASPGAGDTASNVYRIEGAGGAAFAVFSLRGSGSLPFVQWSDTYNLKNVSPDFSLYVDDARFTDAAFTAMCNGLGLGASSASAVLQFSATSDFASVLKEETLANFTGLESRSVAVAGFETNTLYWARIAGENNLGEAYATSPVSFATLEPLAASGVAAFKSRGFTALSATAAVSDFGFGSSGVSVRLEASTVEDFSSVASASEDASAGISSSIALSVANLEPGSSYRLRFRLVNEWGIVSYLPIEGAFETYAAPLCASGIGYVPSADGSALDFSFNVTEVFDGASFSAVLSYGGKMFERKYFSSQGNLSWTDVPAVSGTSAATVSVSAELNGRTYTQTWTLDVSSGARAYTVSSLAEVSGLVFRAGDSVTLPELPVSGDYYAVMDLRSFGLSDDGLTLTAREPGFSAIYAMEWDVSSGAFVRNSSGALALCIPEVRGNGRVFFAKPSGKFEWDAAPSKWVNLTTGDEDRPHLPDDVAMIASPANQIVLKIDATVGELYIGLDEDHPSSSFRFTGTGSSTLTFARSSGEPALLRITGLGRSDVLSGYVNCYFGAGDGNSDTTGIAFELPGGLVADCGAWPDYTDLDMRSFFGRARVFFGERLRYWNIPEGKTLRIINSYGIKLAGDDQGGNANIVWGNYGQITGKGTFFYDGAASTCFDNPFYRFEGVVRVSNKQAYDNFPMGSRGGSFWMVNWTRPAQIATNATLLIDGGAGYNGGVSGAKSFGTVSYGNSHGYGSWGWTDNALPAKKWIMNGGGFTASAMNNNAASWREDGTTDTEPVCVPNGAETLVVSNGFSFISLGQNGNADRPTNSLAFAKLEHAGDGVLHASNDRTYWSYGNSGAGANFRVRTVLGGFHDHSIGGSGRAEATHGASPYNLLEQNAPIVPWIVAPLQWSNYLYFPGATEEGELVLQGHYTAQALDTVDDPERNVLVSGNQTLALSADRTVNSLVVNDNNRVETRLGEGRTLTIASGGLIFESNKERIGTEGGAGDGSNGTISVPDKAWIYSARQSETDPVELWAEIKAPNGAVFSYPGDLRLGGDQTGIGGHIAVNDLRLQLGSESIGCEIAVPVHLHGANAKLVVNKAGSFSKQTLYIWDHGTMGAKFVPAPGTQENVFKVYIDGESVPRGIWGSSESGAPNVDDVHFAGTGTLRIMRDDVARPLLIRIK